MGTSSRKPLAKDLWPGAVLCSTATKSLRVIVREVADPITYDVVDVAGLRHVGFTTARGAWDKATDLYELAAELPNASEAFVGLQVLYDGYKMFVEDAASNVLLRSNDGAMRLQLSPEDWNTRVTIGRLRPIKPTPSTPTTKAADPYPHRCYCGAKALLLSSSVSCSSASCRNHDAAYARAYAKASR